MTFNFTDPSERHYWRVFIANAVAAYQGESPEHVADAVMDVLASEEAATDADTPKPGQHWTRGRVLMWDCGHYVVEDEFCHQCGFPKHA